MFEERKRPAVKPSISHQDKGSFLDGTVFRFKEKAWRLPRSNLRRGNEIAERTEIAFQCEAGFLDDLCVQSHASKLDEVFPVCARKIDQARVLALNNVPAKLEIVGREAELRGKNIHGADGQEAERGIAPGQTVDHLVDGSVAASRDNFFESFLSRMPRERFRFAGTRGGAYHAAASDRFDPRAPTLRFLTSRGRVENDDGVTHNWDKALIFSSNWGCVTSSRAKVPPNWVDCLWSSDRARRDCFARRELVCAIARDTSEDSAGT